MKRCVVLAAAMACLGLACGGSSSTPAADLNVRDVPVTVDVNDVAPEVDVVDDTPRLDLEPLDPGVDPGTDPASEPGCEDDCDVAPDNPAPTCPGGAFCDCTKNDDCLSGLCVQTVEGQVCSRICASEDSCPANWKCSQMAGTGGDTVFVCVNPFSTQCRPCKTDRECVPAVGAGADRYACLPAGDKGSFCGRGCALATDCPSDSTCADVTTAGGTAKYCVPSGGAACPCPAYYVAQGFVTTCSVTNEFGTCTADRTCDQACGAATPAAEVCNNKDDNCNGQTDEGTNGVACETTNEFGTCTGTQTCAAGVATCSGGTPKAETCNGADDNCNGQTDEEGAANCTVYYRDDDGDRYGRDDDFKCLCAPKGVYTATVGHDCDDTKASVNPGATEVCNGIDDNCDGITDPAGSANCTKYYVDADSDTWGVTGTDTCLCAAPASNAATRDGDCNDNDAAIHPGASEVCNGIDDNCNGSTDEGNPGGGVACQTGLLGVCAAGTTACQVGGTIGCVQNVQATAETCNGVDDNCDGNTDEDGAQGCTTLYLDTDGDTWGAIGSARCLCSGQVPAGYTATRGQDCDDLHANVNPAMPELCSTVGVDDNCNGLTDEEGATGCHTFFRDQDLDGWGSQTETKCLCAAAGEYTATKSGDCCDTDDRANPVATTYYDAANNCGNYDYNCNGTPDNEPLPTGGGCAGWSIGSGCGTNLGWQAGTPPACGQSANYVVGGCGYCCFAYTCCCGPTIESHVAKCR